VFIVIGSASSLVALAPGWEPCGRTNVAVEVHGVPTWAIERQRRDALEGWRKFVANGYKTAGNPDWANEQMKKAGPFFIDATDPAWANHALCNATRREYVFCWAGWEDGDPNDPGIQKCREATRGPGTGGVYCIDLDRPHNPGPVREWLHGYLSRAAPDVADYQDAAAAIGMICHANPNWTLEDAAQFWVNNRKQEAK
jgi:hypothetical protein